MHFLLIYRVRYRFGHFLLKFFRKLEFRKKIGLSLIFFLKIVLCNVIFVTEDFLVLGFQATEVGLFTVEVDICKSGPEGQIGVGVGGVRGCYVLVLLMLGGSVVG